MIKTPLHTAVEQKRTKLVSKLINEGANVNAKNSDGVTPLQLAFLDDKININIVKLLIAAGADVNVQKGDTLLHLAVYKKKFNIVKALVDAGAEIDARDKYNGTPLLKAMSLMNVDVKDRLDVLKILLEAGADVNAKNWIDYNCLHHFAFLDMDVNILKCLLQAGIDINAQSDCGNTFLCNQLACYNLSVSKLELILDAGADVNLINNSGETALHLLIENLLCSTYFGRKEIILIRKSTKFLIEYTDVNLITQNGRNILSNILESDEFLPHRKDFYDIIIEHITKLKVLDLYVDSQLMSTISNNNEFKCYFTACTQELEKAKNTKLYKSWVTFFNLLVDKKLKLVKYAGNSDLVEDFEKNVDRFPIYGSLMKDNVSEGIKGRQFFDGAAFTLNYYCPIFDPNHLIIREILDTLNAEDWKKLSRNKRSR